MGYSTLKAALDAVVKTNGRQQITGSNLNGVMTQILQGVDLLERANPADTSGKGFMVLKGNLTFAEQVTTANKIYEIRDRFDLDGESVTIPAGSVLKFNGGSINNGKLLISNSNVTIYGNGETNDRLQIELQSANNVSIRGLEFSGYKVDGSSVTANDLVGLLFNSNTPCNNFSFRNCKVHGFNYGIRVCGCNLTIADNTFYDNGGNSVPGGVHDGEVDILVSGQYSEEVNHINILIRGNRCLSSNVHRNIDGGKNYWTGNIIIDNNFCVSCLADGVTENPNAIKTQCILVGYAGTSTNEKCVLITNNVCKHCHWSAIYVRASSYVGELKNRYVALILSNIVDNVTRASTDTASHIISGIGVEIGDGSLICLNSVSNVKDEVLNENASGISLGFVRAGCHSIVAENFIRNCNSGIVNDSYANGIEIINNTIDFCTYGISIVDAARSGVSAPVDGEFVNVSGNVLKNYGYGGISVQNIYGNNINIKDNLILYGGETSVYGMRVILRFPDVQCFNIERNLFNTANIGFDFSFGPVVRNNNLIFKNNTFKNCTTAMKVTANGKRQLFLIEGCKFINCTTRWSNHSYWMCIWEGKWLQNGCFEFYEDEYFTGTNSAYGQVTNAPLNFFAKKFLKGDVILTNNRFTRAICQADSPASFTDADAKWLCENAIMTTAELGICAVKGQVAYDTTLNKVVVYNGTAWVNPDGSPLA